MMYIYGNSSYVKNKLKAKLHDNTNTHGNLIGKTS